jgi:hypothetical protein
MTLNTKSILKRITPEKISRVIQGDKLDKTDIISRIVFRPAGGDHNSSGNSVVIEKIEFLKHHINTVANDEWLQKFLVCATGQANLTAASRIIIIPTGGVMCAAHTCTNTLEIPNSHDTPPLDEQDHYKKFILSLEMLIECVDFSTL